MKLELSRTRAHSILALGLGEFGLSAVQHLKQLLPQVTVVHDCQTFLDLIATEGVYISVLAAWRAMPAFSDAMDACAHNTGTISCALTLQDSEMVMGPLVLPGATACWRCWATRASQADSLAKIQAQKRAFYAEHPEIGPCGYLPSLVLHGIAQLVSALESLPNLKCGGVALRTNLFTRQVVEERATGLDNCNRCGLQRPLATRSYARLQSALQTMKYREQL